MTSTLDWLERLVAHPTVSSDTNLPLIEEIETALASAGAVCERFSPDQDRQKEPASGASLGPDGSGG